MTSLTIGLPVYNGAKTLARSFDNLIAQTHSDFIAVVSDNASTDATADICQSYAARDKRIVYVRQSENLIWNENFRFALERAQTPYFMWMTHDDIWDPRYAAENIRRLNADPDAVCSVSRTIYFDDLGAEDLCRDTGPLTGPPAQRLRDFFLRMDRCARFYGVYRTQALKESFPPDLHLFGADWLVVALTLLKGTHLEVEEVLLRREEQPSGHYARRFGATDRFRPRRFEALRPLRRMEQELRRRLPPDVWTEVQWPLRLLDLRMLAYFSEAYLSPLSPVIRPLRSLLAHRIHRKWQIDDFDVAKRH